METTSPPNIVDDHADLAGDSSSAGIVKGVEQSTIDVNEGNGNVALCSIPGVLSAIGSPTGSAQGSITGSLAGSVVGSAAVSKTGSILGSMASSSGGSVMQTKKDDFAHLYICAKDLDDWVMTAEEPVELEWTMTVVEFFDWISVTRPHINAGRIVMIYAGKQIPENKYSWGFRKLGIRDGTVITLQPTLLRGWCWHTVGYYEDKFMRELADRVLKTEDGRIDLDQVKSMIPLAPVLGEIKHFLRKYPEKIYLRSDLNTGKTWVHINENRRLPTFDRLPIEMGRIYQHVPKGYEWDEYFENDSMKPLIQELDIPGREIEIVIMSATGLFRPDDIFSTVNPSVEIFFDRDYDPEFDAAKFNKFKRSVKFVGETKKCFATSAPYWSDYKSRFLLPLDANDDIELCQLAFLIMDHNKRKEEEGEKFPVAVARIDGEDLAAFVGQPKSVIEKVPLMRGKQKCGEITVLATKGQGAYDFMVNCVKGCRTDTPCSNAMSFMFCKVRWNDEEICTTGQVFDHTNATWATIEQEPIYVNCHPFLSLNDCTLEVQLWVASSDQPSADTYFLGSLHLAKEDLVEFLGGDPFYRKSVTRTLKRSVYVPKEQRANEIAGSMTLIGGRTGFISPPDDYHSSDVIFGKTEVDDDVKIMPSTTLDVSADVNPSQVVQSDGANAPVVDPDKEYTDEELAEFKKQQLMEEIAQQAELEAKAAEEEKLRLQALRVEREKKMMTKAKIYEVRVLRVYDLAFAQNSENLICIGHIGYVNMGVTSMVTPIVGEFKTSDADWGNASINSFVFHLRIPHVDDDLYIVDEEVDYLKVSIFDVKKNGRWGKFLGCIKFAGHDLYKLVNEDGFAKEHDFQLQKDEIIPNAVGGSLVVRVGPKGARTEAERIIAIEALKDVKVKKIDIRNKKVYCVVYYNKVEIGRTGVKFVDYILRAKAMESMSESKDIESFKDNVSTTEAGDHSDIEEGDSIENNTTTLPKLDGAVPEGTGNRGRNRDAAIFHKVVDVIYGAGDTSSMIYFERFPPEKPQREGNLLEIELIAEVCLYVHHNIFSN